MRLMKEEMGFVDFRGALLYTAFNKAQSVARLLQQWIDEAD
jgi:hypothetical protein